MTETTAEAVLSDDQLVRLAGKGSREAFEIIAQRYTPMVHVTAGSYYMAGWEREDLIQEGMIGLYKAVRDYQPGKGGASFCTFASICVLRSILTAVKSASRKKHSPLNSYISLNKGFEEEEENLYLLRKVSHTSEAFADPETIIINRENLDRIACRIEQSLSSFEFNVLMYYLDGRSYKEIAALTGKTMKSVDNAIQRTKGKLKAELPNM